MSRKPNSLKNRYREINLDLDMNPKSLKRQLQKFRKLSSEGWKIWGAEALPGIGRIMICLRNKSLYKKTQKRNRKA